MNSTKTFNQRLIETCEQYSEKIGMRIVGDDSEIYTFGEMLRQIRAVAFRLEQENVAFGDRVALIGENHPSWAIAYLATLRGLRAARPARRNRNADEFFGKLRSKARISVAGRNGKI
jgi:acyl-CoA synthetase (AMP-forming)/AMP-acid ligase II